MIKKIDPEDPNGVALALQQLGVEPSDCCRHKHRDENEYTALLKRLSRIEGQVRGIKAMVERGAYCPDILIQTSAVNSALNSFSKVLLSNHIRFLIISFISISEMKMLSVSEQIP